MILKLFNLFSDLLFQKSCCFAQFCFCIFQSLYKGFIRGLHVLNRIDQSQNLVNFQCKRLGIHHCDNLFFQRRHGIGDHFQICIGDYRFHPFLINGTHKIESCQRILDCGNLLEDLIDRAAFLNQFIEFNNRQFQALNVFFHIGYAVDQIGNIPGKNIEFRFKPQNNIRKLFVFNGKVQKRISKIVHRFIQGNNFRGIGINIGDILRNIMFDFGNRCIQKCLQGTLCQVKSTFLTQFNQNIVDFFQFNIDIFNCTLVFGQRPKSGNCRFKIRNFCIHIRCFC